MSGLGSSVLGNLVVMEHFTGAQRAFCVKHYYKNGDSCAIVRRLFWREFRLHDLNLSDGMCDSIVGQKVRSYWFDSQTEACGTPKVNKNGRHN